MLDQKVILLGILFIAAAVVAFGIYWANKKNTSSIDDETVNSLKHQQKERLKNEEKFQDDVDDYIAENS